MKKRSMQQLCKLAAQSVHKKAEERTAAIILAAGSGRRMGGGVKKQYRQIKDRPLIYYSLKTFQESFVNEIILVAAPGETSYCQKEIVEKYGFHKVSCIVEGGKERYHSVANGLKAISLKAIGSQNVEYVFIHDGARPLVTEEILERALACVREHGACVAGMPVKDTIKIADEKGNIISTPNRDRVWMVQTPQTFAYPLIKGAYEELLAREQELIADGISITDDAMVVETLTGHTVRLIAGSYENIKITTPEDIKMAENLI